MHAELRVLRALAFLGAIGWVWGCADRTTGPGPQPVTIGPSGGVLSFVNGSVVLAFPPGAVTQQTAITVTPTSAFPADAAVVDGTVFDLGPSGIQFAQAVQLTILYDVANLPPAADEAHLRLARVSAGTWTTLVGSSVDTGADAVTGTIDGFSLYGLRVVSSIASVATVTVVPASVSVDVGATVQLRAELRDDGGELLEGREVAWSSDNGAVATVDADGLVTGEGAGGTTIFATSEGQMGAAEVTVTEAMGGPPALQVVVEGLADPVYLTAPDMDRLFVVEQGGRIVVVESGQLLSRPFLDISGLVSGGSEQGLLSMAFHPDYAQNGLFYVYYTDVSGDTQVVRYSVSGDPRVAEPGSATPILTVGQPFGNHNGGLLLFGPDRMLYIGLGDGGSAGDPQGNGQDRGTVLGAILRIDVDGGLPYAIPSDNPFVNDPNARDEIWAYGLRNPWRYAFDTQTNRLYIADVGQNRLEEVNVEAADQGGLNYGWNIMEGSSCFPSDPCNQAGLILPALEYGHSPECSVTGGFVYRGAALPALRGHYFYADYCAGWVRSFLYRDGAVTEQTERFRSLGRVLSFGRDAAGELYVLTGDGRVQKMVPGG